MLLGAGTPVVWAVDTAQAEEKYPDTALILDASGSMWAPDASGQVRMDAAKEATKKLVEQLPEEQKVALLTYGIGTGNSDAEKEAGCQDVHTLVKLGGARGDITSQIDGLVASGYTPIGPALLAAEKELDGSGKREIVLVSDGIDTCAPPQVADVAREIRERSGDDIVINVVGFNVNEEARNQLQEVAQVGGGVYADASDADSLLQTLSAKTGNGGDAAEDGKSTSTETTTSESSTDATTSESESSTTESTGAASEPTSGETAENGATVALGGLDGEKPAPEVYKGTIPAVTQEGGEAKDQELSWTVDLEEGQQLNAGFLVPAPKENTVAGGSTITLTPTLTSADGKTCVATATEAKVDNDFSFTQSASLLSPVIEKNGVCKPGKYTLSLQRSGDLVGDQELPVDVSLWGVPQVAEDKMTKPAEEPAIEEITVGEASGKLPTDMDMAAAPSVKEGTYDVELAPGETYWFKVPVEDGQRLQMQMQAEPTGAEGHNVGWKVFGPLYNPIELHQGDKGNVALNANEATNAGIATQPIQWSNLATEGPAANGFLAGEQLVALRHTAPEGQNTPAKFRLALANTGQSAQAPDFKNATGVAETKADKAATNTNKNGANVWWLLLLLFTLVGIVSYVAARKKWDNDAA
ncbi:VWA domain-containing protein [Corynebacterium sp.]|uniref:vWA domain-containing protein n=1 Tax=Corynebacterium sp. TaxID=1720 RepID=UPI0026DCABDD|nr:VWA domain-containing protein [Corynebacterium sp.]MDO5076635.1 VWA domain-containing protein [Corynebacterium sp.]